MNTWLRKRHPRLLPQDAEEVVQDALVTLVVKYNAGMPLEDIKKITPIVLQRRVCDHARKNSRYQDRHAPLELADRVKEHQAKSVAFAVFESTGLDLDDEEINFVTSLHAHDDPVVGLDLSTPQKRRRAARLFWQIATK
jgi:DNA-directed RNA polymerase specialized sigma24 family protein